MHNLFVSYDLHQPGRNYESVIAAIKAQGNWAKPLESVFFLDTAKTAEAVHAAVRAAMDANDSLLVIDASNNHAVWSNLAPNVSDYIRGHWNATRRAA
jgi:hypothetical protein